jgi:diamine N-acetyltransferase
MTTAPIQARQSGSAIFEPMTPSAAVSLAAALAQIDPWAHYNYTPGALAEYLAGNEADAPRFKIVVDGELAGAIVYRRNWLRGPYLQFLGILPAFQDRGIGSAAVVWFEREAGDGRAQNLWVAASDFNVRALAFYEQHGFVRVATIDALVAEGVSEILFRKRLTVR